MSKLLSGLVCSTLLCGICIAQPAPPPGGEGDRKPPQQEQRDRDHHDGDRGDRGGPQGDRQDGPPGRPGLPGRQGPPRVGPIEQMRNYLDLVERYAKLANDSNATAVAAVITTTDILRPRGTQAIIEKLEKMLSESKNPVVTRTIRLQLADFYRQSNQADKAMEHLDALVAEASK